MTLNASNSIAVSTSETIAIRATLGSSIYHLHLFLVFLFGFVATYVSAAAFLVSDPFSRFVPICRLYLGGSGHRSRFSCRDSRLSARAKMQGPVGWMATDKIKQPIN